MAERQGTTTNYLDIGAEFEGKYRIVRELGRGGFGTVYLAYQEKMDRHVAIKVLKSGIGEVHATAKDRFLREVKIISKLRHPNTVTIHDFGETSRGVLYMVLEFVEGETVKQQLKRDGAQPYARALRIARQIAKSLAEAHRHGVIHRDLKPANIMVTKLHGEPDFVKVLDFGVARLLRTDDKDLTSVGLPDGERELIGTPRYMSPEQVRGESLGPASDVYSVGLILYEMLIGEPAVQGDTTMALITQQISPEELKLEGLPALPPPLANLIRKATAKKMGRRFQGAEAFNAQLEQVLAGLEGRNTGGFPAHPPTSGRGLRASGRGAEPATGWRRRPTSGPELAGAGLECIGSGHGCRGGRSCGRPGGQRGLLGQFSIPAHPASGGRRDRGVRRRPAAASLRSQQPLCRVCSAQAQRLAGHWADAGTATGRGGRSRRVCHRPDAPDALWPGRRHGAVYRLFDRQCHLWPVFVGLPQADGLHHLGRRHPAAHGAGRQQPA